MTDPAELSEEQKSTMYQVWDTSATHIVRTRHHSIIINGAVEEIKFEYNKPTYLPFEIAIKFNQPGFVVKDPSGFPVETPAKKNDDVSAKLEKNEVIARFDELSIEALIVRVVMRPGGEKLSKSTSKKELIDFLVADKGPKTAPRRPPVHIDENPVDEDAEFSEEELKSLIPDTAPQGADEEEELPYNEE